MNKIHKTKKYKEFNKVSGNREISQANLNKLVDAIKTSDMLEINPIIVNERMEVIDGQHRLAAAEELEIPIFYVIQEGTGVEEVVILNTVSKNWGMYDFAKSYAELGKSQYQDLLDVQGAFSMNLTLLLAILDEKEYCDNKHTTTKTFKAGRFEMTGAQRDKLVLVCKELEKVKPYYRKWNNRVFVSSMLTILKHKGFKMDKFLNKLANGKEIPLCDNKRDYLREIEDIYNHKIKEDNKQRFF
jgi:hypothetical protein